MYVTRPTLKSKLRKAIIVPAVTALALTVIFTIVFGWISHRNTIERTRTEISSQANTLARRISAEFLIGSRGAPYAVLDNLKNELGISEISLLRETPPCQIDGAGNCQTLSNGQLVAVVKVPNISEQVFVTVGKRVPTIQSSIPFQVLVWAVLPILLIIGYATYLQQKQLRNYFLRPIESIIDKTESRTDLPKHWPREFVKLHEELDDAFQKRDQAIIGQIASGVIHDLKTLLQPISGATQLTGEAPDPSRREKNLEMLLRACERNIPKMQNMLESVLDGNREIRLQSRKDDVVTTLKAAIHNAHEVANKNNLIQIETDFFQEKLFVLHDPGQLERALTNIIKNGMEASTLIQGERKLRISLIESNESAYQILIDDSGPGLPLPLDQLLASRRTSKTRGTGLGLLISQKIIGAHLGKLEGDKSDLLQGARFTVSLSKGVNA